MTRQRTIARYTTLKGTGLHTGEAVAMTLGPAEAGTGVVFVRKDMDGAEIPARLENTLPAQYATVLGANGATISTVEHLLSAASGIGVDNLRVEIDGGEIPIFDGSAAPFVRAFLRAGFIEQDAPRRYLSPRRELTFRVNGSFVRLAPAKDFRMSYAIDFPGTPIGRQELSLAINHESYATELASARTFGFERDLEVMRAKGLIRGASLESAILVGEHGVVNGALRFPDEFVRHKMLDAVGDIALVGMPVLGHFEASKAGHLAHALAFKEWLQDEEAFDIVEPGRRKSSGIMSHARRAAALL